MFARTVGSLSKYHIVAWKSSPGSTATTGDHIVFSSFSSETLVTRAEVSPTKMWGSSSLSRTICSVIIPSQKNQPNGRSASSSHSAKLWLGGPTKTVSSPGPSS
ncbi:MAG: hypothetical protein EA397_04830 [Deltaproteobacteria bacterium]|nr:MAG: hypothetical protein EA397_04830 [Deltaproteobacteria bacterium]